MMAVRSLLRGLPRAAQSTATPLHRAAGVPLPSPAARFSSNPEGPWRRGPDETPFPSPQSQPPQSPFPSPRPPPPPFSSTNARPPFLSSAGGWPPSPSAGAGPSFLSGVSRVIRPPAGRATPSFAAGPPPLSAAPPQNPSSNFFSMKSLEKGFDINSMLREEESPEDKTHCLHVHLKNRNTFVTLTDAKGNKKLGASAGTVQKGAAANSRYAAEATAEHMGREVRKMGIKSVVVKIKGFAMFNKKKKVILAFRNGYRGDGVADGPIVAIHDVTAFPHNGCRKPKRPRK